jgi:hypothetical protein
MRTIIIRIKGLSRAAKAALTVAVVVLVIMGLLGGEYLMITANYDHAKAQEKIQIAQSKADEEAAIRAAVAYSDSQWCETLDLLTSHPVPYPADPAANPSRVQSYDYYESFLHVKGKFGCK